MFPIRKIVLFKHGMGFFERQKKVQGEEPINLFFKTADINDVLKSLTTVDLDGGSIASISYQAQTPIMKQLEQLSLQLTDGQYSLTELLQQSIGAEVTLKFEKEKVEGVVLGLETATRMDAKTDRPTDVKLINMLVDGGSSITSFPVLDIKSFTFKDPTLKHDLQHLLDVLLNAKKKDLKKLTIFTAGKGDRTVVANYLIETPVWKTSYRLLLSKEKNFIQGWCLVDNTQDEDWVNVNLTLIGGHPNSFVHDLYSPRFRKRPIIQVKHEAPPNPPILADVLPNHSESLLKDAPAMLSSLSQGGPQIGQVSAPAKPPDASQYRPPPPISVVPPAQAMLSETIRKVDAVDVFRYPIDKPVSVKRGQSALVPFLSAELKGGHCTLFNHSANANHPLSVVLLKNRYGVALDGGPIAIFDEETCIGEAMIDTVRPGDDKFVPFGVETNVTVSFVDTTDWRNYHKAELAAGLLTLTRYKIQKREYKFDHKGATDIKQMYLEHRFLKGEWELAETGAPVSKTENYYRFLFEVPAGQITLFAVTERILQKDIVDLHHIDAEKLAFWHKSKFITDETQAFLQKEILPKKVALEKQAEEINKLQTAAYNALLKQNEARDYVSGRIGYSKLGAEEKDMLSEQLQIMIDQEKEIKAKNVQAREKKETLVKDQAEFDKLLLKPNKGMSSTVEVFAPPPKVTVAPTKD